MKSFSILRNFGLVVLLGLFASGLNAQQLSFDFNNEASHEGFSLTASKATSLRLSHKLTHMRLENMNTDKGSGQVISLNSIYCQTKEAHLIYQETAAILLFQTVPLPSLSCTATRKIL